MEALWNEGPSSVREILAQFERRARPAYTTVQTMVGRLEAKKAVRRVKKIGNAYIFDACVSRSAARQRWADDLLAIFGGPQPLVAHLIESGRLTLADVRDAERVLRQVALKRDAPRATSTRIRRP